MDIIQQLFYGYIQPMEACMPQTREYREAAKELSRISMHLSKLLNQEQNLAFSEYEVARSAAEVHIEAELFRTGMILGAALERELHPSDMP